MVEAIAAVVNLSYTVLYMQASPWAFPVAAFGAILFAGICWRKSMLAEFGLWVFYIGFAVYGWITTSEHWPEPAFSAPHLHLFSCVLVLAGTWMLARLLRAWGERTAAGWDAFTTVGSLVATYWMLSFDPLNWWYWMVIDAAAVVLYLKNGLFWGAGLFAVYGLLAFEGWFNLFTWI
jgi:nicotinamide mononucleotide transporter